MATPPIQEVLLKTFNDSSQPAHHRQLARTLLDFIAARTAVMDTEPDEDRGVRDANLYFCATLVWMGVQKLSMGENGTTILIADDDPTAPWWKPEKRCTPTPLPVKGGPSADDPDDFSSDFD